MTTIEQIQQNDTYKQVLRDSYGGIMYDVSNRGKYDTAELLQLWSKVTPAERESAGGIMKGVFNFLQEVK